MQDLVDSGNGEYIHEPLIRGLSRGRNRGLATIRGEIIAFPDDDCWYGPKLLAQVSETIDTRAVDGISVKLSAENGQGNLLRWLEHETSITPWRIPRTVTSATLFLRSELVQSIDGFDEELGSGSGTPFGAGEETDYILRALNTSARLDYVPTLAVFHPEWREEGTTQEIRAKVRRYNRGFGRVLRKHKRYIDITYWLARSLMGVAVKVARLDRRGLQHQLDQFSGRLQGWRAPLQ